MNLTATDLLEIRGIVKDVVDVAIKPMQDELEAIRNDTAEIYDEITAIKKDIKGIPATIADLPPLSGSRQSFRKLTLEEKLLILNSQLLEAARQAGVSLPG